MIVHDNERFIKYLRKFIVTSNDNCVEIDNELYVDKIYEEFKPDWILIDINHKKIKSFVFAEGIKTKYPAARFIMIADYTDERLKIKAHEVGAYAFVSKENLFELYDLVHSENNLSK